MNTWRAAGRDEVEGLLEAEVAVLHPSHRSMFDAMRVLLRQVPVSGASGEHVFVVAEHQGKILYFSDVEDGWEIAEPDDHGGIVERGCNQFELGHIMWQLFGDPDAPR